LNVREAGEAAPHHDVTWGRVLGTSQIASEPGNTKEIIGQGAVVGSMATSGSRAPVYEQVIIPSFINNVTYVREAGKRERWLE
jgi:hypothetical protein